MDAIIYSDICISCLRYWIHACIDCRRHNCQLTVPFKVTTFYLVIPGWMMEILEKSLLTSAIFKFFVVVCCYQNIIIFSFMYRFFRWCVEANNPLKTVYKKKHGKESWSSFCLRYWCFGSVAYTACHRSQMLRKDKLISVSVSYRCSEWVSWTCFASDTGASEAGYIDGYVSTTLDHIRMLRYHLKI